MTSSLRNSIHRRNHKERSQLAHRTKLGILEKHADYVKRARDYHSKQDRLTRLKQKAAEKNKDEFYFSMQNKKTKAGSSRIPHVLRLICLQEGVHIQDRGNVALPTDIVKVLKTQDENYVRTVRAAGLKKIDKLKKQLTEMADLMKPDLFDEQAENDLEQEELQVLIDAGIISGRSRPGRKGKHIIFVENDAEAHNYRPIQSSSSTSDQVDADIIEEEEVDLGWKSTSTKKSQTPDYESFGEVQDEVSPGDKRRRLLKELAARLVRDQQLRYSQREFEMQRLMMGKGGRKKIMGAEKVEGDSDSEEDEDEDDARKSKPKKTSKTNDETYKPRVYKWRIERKR